MISTAYMAALHQGHADDYARKASNYRACLVHDCPAPWSDHYADQCEEVAKAHLATAKAWQGAAVHTEVSQAADGTGILWEVFRAAGGEELRRSLLGVYPTPDAALAQRVA